MSRHRNHAQRSRTEITLFIGFSHRRHLEGGVRPAREQPRPVGGALAAPQLRGVPGQAAPLAVHLALPRGALLFAPAPRLPRHVALKRVRQLARHHLPHLTPTPRDPAPTPGNSRGVADRGQGRVKRALENAIRMKASGTDDMERESARGTENSKPPEL